MTEIEVALSRLDRGQRDRLRDLAGRWNVSSGDRAIGDVFGALMDLLDAASGREDYVLNFHERQLSD